ncbi:hypothetical protein HZS_691 [Henneguya salminicola]|nr:hypothetical protein HZS_691 [Henneguya salminicola]
MSKVSAVKQAVLGSSLYKSKTKTSLLITVALALTPLIIDSMLTDDSFQCPKKRGKLISSILLFGPTVCITLLGLSHSIKYIREHDNRSLFHMTKRITARIFSIGIMMCITIGSSFLLSEHYVCLVYTKLNNTTFTRSHAVTQSREIGWLIIMMTLFMTFVIAIIQLMFYRQNYFQKAIKLYTSMLRKESKKQLEDALCQLSNRVVQNKLEKGKRSYPDLAQDEAENMNNILFIFRKERKNILDSKKNFLPSKMSFRERIHFFSMSFDDNIDESHLDIDFFSN